MMEDGVRKAELEMFSVLFQRASKMLAAEQLRNATEWAKFLAQGEQWCRVTEAGIEIIPVEAARGGK